MKKVVFAILIGIVFLMMGCNDENGYSLDQQWIGFGILEDTSNNKIVMDNGDVLLPIAYAYATNYLGDSRDGFQNGDRILVNFTILGDDTNEAGDVVAYFVKINSAREILMKGILDITSENQDSIGNDPIVVQDVWMAQGLLNFKFRYWGKYATHFINLVKQPGELNPGEQPFQLELRHNSNGDEESVPYTSFVSFKLDSLEIAGLDSVQFKVSAVDYDGDLFEYEGFYTYGENN